MADQSVKTQKQPEPGSAKMPERGAALDSKPVAGLEAGKETKEILKHQRDVINVQGVVQQQVFNALFGTKTAAEPVQSKTSISRPSRLRSRSTAKPEKKTDHKHGKAEEQSSISAEVREQMAIRAATSGAAARSTAAAASNRNIQRGTNPGQSVDGQQLEEGISEGIQQVLVGTDNLEEGLANDKRFDQNTQAEQPSAEGPTTPEQALSALEVGTSAETQKLLDVVGPEAILTFREKLQQVWVTLDENSARQLDVIARMPATLSGSTATELLMVESPQGIHFVAFLKNRNDFEVLATFDRRALLPDSPSRQLIEAGLIAYEQVDTVFKEGGQKIEESVKQIAASKGSNDVVFLELQRLMVQEKRRRRRFRQLMDYFIDKLDEIDLQGDPDEAPFVPINLEPESEKAPQTEQPVVTASDAKLQDGFSLQPQDSDEVKGKEAA